MTKSKKSAFAFGAACALALTGGIAALKTLPVAAEGENERGYYGTELAGKSDYALATAFYDELVAMTKERTIPAATEDETEKTVPSEFHEGDSHKVTNAAFTEEVFKAYAEEGNTTLVKAYGAALDCFRYDYVELFYINFDALAFTVTKEVKPTLPPEETETVDESGDLPAEPEYVWGLTIGAQNYFLRSISKGDVEGMITSYETKLGELVIAVNGSITSETPTTAEKVAAASKALSEKLTFNYDNAYASTAYSLVEGKANSDGAARAFKALMNELEVDCELVSGYYVQNGITKAWTWNYVKDGENWYAVDVAANLVAGSQKYVNATSETFLLDHFADKVVSLSKYKLDYPTLTEGKLDVDGGALEITKDVAVEDRDDKAVTVSLKDRDIDSVKIRVKVTVKTKETDDEGNETETETETKEWGDWKTIKAYMAEVNVPATPGEGEEPGDPVENVRIDEANSIAYFFALTEGEYEFGLFDTDNKRVIPVAIGAGDIGGTPQDVTKTHSVTITFAESLIKIDAGKEVGIDFTVETLTGEKVDGVDGKVGEIAFTPDENGLGTTVTFQFTPDARLKYNGLRYIFTPTNLAGTKPGQITVPSEEGGEPTVKDVSVADTDTVLKSYSLVFKRDSIVAEKVYGGSNLYTEIVAKPSLAFNNELSLDGWTYGNNKSVNDNMKSSLTLSATRPVEDDTNKISTAVAAKYTETDVVKATVPYNVSLTLDGQAVTVPDGSYVKLAFPYPENFMPGDTDYEKVVFKVLQFKRGENDEIDYDNPTAVDAVATWQGIVAAVNGIDAFAVVALDKAVLGESDLLKEQAILTQTTGVGGKVTAAGNKPVNTLKGDDSITYTLTPETGYKVGFVTVNGEVKEVTGNTFTLNYTDLVKVGEDDSTEAVLNNVLQVGFVKDDENAELAAEVASGFANGFIKKQLSSNPYSTDEKSEITSAAYPSGAIEIGTGIIDPPGNTETPNPNTVTTKMQYIILAGVVGGIILIGVIAIIYCGAIRPKIIREREEEAERAAANRERRANRNRMNGSRGNRMPPRM